MKKDCRNKKHHRHSRHGVRYPEERLSVVSNESSKRDVKAEGLRERKVSVNLERCIGCGHCVDVCKGGALSMVGH